MELYLIRHAQSNNNALKEGKERVCDPPLTETGEVQASMVAEYLKSNARAVVSPIEDLHNRLGYDFTLLFCSAMLRTLKTTTPIAKALVMEPQIWMDVHEEGGIWLDPGDGPPATYPGVTLSELESQFPGFTAPPELGEDGWWNRPAETQEQWRARAKRVSEKLHDEFGDTEERIAIVSHGGFMNDLLHALLETHETSEVYFSHQNTAITRLDFEADKKVRIRYLNRLDHLSDEMIT